jgi:antitoxin component HigA of HigAB toxin-antitoxin module
MKQKWAVTASQEDKQQRKREIIANKNTTDSCYLSKRLLSLQKRHNERRNTMRQKTLEFLEAHKSETPSKWREEAEWRRENASWLRHSQQIAVQVLLKMDELHLSQKALAERMNCTQQYVSKILKGKENLSLDIISRLEDALQINLVYSGSKFKEVEMAL